MLYLTVNCFKVFKADFIIKPHMNFFSTTLFFRIKNVDIIMSLDQNIQVLDNDD